MTAVEKAKRMGRPRRPNKTPFGRWTDNCGISIEDIAAKLKITIATVYNLRNGHAKPGLDLAVRIAELTGGAVTAASWRKR